MNEDFDPTNKDNDDEDMTTEDWVIIADQLDNLVSIIVGYKNKLMVAGIDEANAEFMAIEFHGVMMQRQIALLG